LHARLKCETHSFDPTVDGKNALKHVTTFHKLGISSDTSADNICFHTMSNVTRMLNHANRTIDIFKIDCEVFK
jgi:hypothetical protein